MRPVPYIGVTGFMSQGEVAAALNAFRDGPATGGRKIMVGVLASSKTLAGQKNKWPNRYPAPRDIARLFSTDPRALNLIHYATDDQSTLDEQLRTLLRLGGPNLHGFQLNMAWPDPGALEVLEGKRVVLQIGAKAIALAGDAEDIASCVDEYTHDGHITDVLIDASGGKGVPMDPDLVIACVDAIADWHPDLGIGVAGGLSAATLGSLRPITGTFPFVSIDAEGRLRTDDDRLDVAAMQEYLIVARQTLR
jgi:hypothetical protein